jgi:hypothetical protein
VVSFDTFDIQHVYREKNMVVDQLSKVEIQMDYGQWIIVEDNNETLYEFYHRPFIEDK